MMDDHPRITKAPWTAEEVAALNCFQKIAPWHPFTCDGLSGECRAVLYATQDGWRCCRCSYLQDWAWEFMIGWGKA